MTEFPQPTATSSHSPPKIKSISLKIALVAVLVAFLVGILVGMQIETLRESVFIDILAERTP